MGSSSVQIIGVAVFLFLFSLSTFPFDSSFHHWSQVSSMVYVNVKDCRVAGWKNGDIFLSASFGQLVLGSEFFFHIFQNNQVNVSHKFREM